MKTNMPHQDEKLREEFRNKMKYLWDKYGEEYEIYNPEAFEEELHDFLISYIHHEREQLIDSINQMKRKHYYEEAPLKHRNDYNDAYNEILESVISLIKK